MEEKAIEHIIEELKNEEDIEGALQCIPSSAKPFVRITDTITLESEASDIQEQLSSVYEDVTGRFPDGSVSPLKQRVCKPQTAKRKREPEEELYPILYKLKTSRQKF